METCETCSWRDECECCYDPPKIVSGLTTKDKSPDYTLERDKHKYYREESTFHSLRPSVAVWEYHKGKKRCFDFKKACRFHKKD